MVVRNSMRWEETAGSVDTGWGRWGMEGPRGGGFVEEGPQGGRVPGMEGRARGQFTLRALSRCPFVSVEGGQSCIFHSVEKEHPRTAQNWEGGSVWRSP